MQNKEKFAHLAAFGVFGISLDAFFPDPLKGIDIESEYRLIQRKESRLSANMRRQVVAAYEYEHRESDGDT